jgi:hypothetical protein
MVRRRGLQIGVLLILAAAGGCTGKGITISNTEGGNGISISGGKTVTGSGTVKAETRTVSGFSTVVLNGVGKVVITQGEKEGVTVRAEDNLLPLLKTEVVDGSLKLGLASQTTLKPTKPIEFDIEVKSLKAIQVAGAGDIEASKLSGKELRISLAGAGNVKLVGDVNSLNIESEGAGNVEAAELKAKEATVSSRGAGHMLVNASEKLKVTLSGVGQVEYMGTPQIEKDISGLGQVKRHE